MENKKVINYRGNIVLVHGAGVGGWVFRDVATLLRAHGYQVHTPTFTGLGERVHLLNHEINIETHINDIINCIEKNGLEEVILLGHSYGGAIISAVVDRVPEKIEKQIYLDSFFLRDGQSIVDVFGSEREEDLQKLADTEGEGWLLPRRIFGKSHPLIGDMPWKPYLEKVSINEEVVKNIKGYFIDCTNPIHFEQLIEPKKEMTKLSIERGWRVFKLDSDHVPMTKSPERENLVDIILKIVEGK